jgi:hypothetical protein
VGFCDHGNEISGPTNVGKFGLAEPVLDSQELCSMKLVNLVNIIVFIMHVTICNWLDACLYLSRNILNTFRRLE